MLMLLVFGPHLEWQGFWPILTLVVPLTGWSLQLDKPHQSDLTSAVLSKANCPCWISGVLVRARTKFHLNLPFSRLKSPDSNCHSSKVNDL